MLSTLVFLGTAFVSGIMQGVGDSLGLEELGPAPRTVEVRRWIPGEALGLSLGPEMCSKSLWNQNTPFQHPAASLLEMI